MAHKKYDDRPDLDFEGRIKGVFPSGYKGGKASHDADFRAGFKAGKKAFQQWSGTTFLDVEAAYRRVSSKHGSWWEDGFQAAIGLGRGAYNSKSAQLAIAMGLGSVSKKDKNPPTPRTDNYSVRIQQTSGTWRNVNSELTLAEAKAETKRLSKKWVVAVFKGRKKHWSPKE